jgi:hypothetical protein
MSLSVHGKLADRRSLFDAFCSASRRVRSREIVPCRANHLRAKSGGNALLTAANLLRNAAQIMS